MVSWANVIPNNKDFVKFETFGTVTKFVIVWLLVACWLYNQTQNIFTHLYTNSSVEDGITVIVEFIMLNI